MVVIVEASAAWVRCVRALAKRALVQRGGPSWAVSRLGPMRHGSITRSSCGPCSPVRNGCSLHSRSSHSRHLRKTALVEASEVVD